MFSEIKKLLNAEGIEQIGIIKIEDCEIINERIMPKDAKSAILFSIPYRTDGRKTNDGFSEYARIYDYHGFCRQLYEKVIIRMQNKTGFNFYGFCDHSPINEKTSIAKCGLGVIGRNSLFIDNKFGSFVFIGSIITDMPTTANASNIKNCIDCGKCIKTCPSSAIVNKGIDRTKCLSGISQKKTKSDEEKALLRANNIVWGCDLCQNVCPHNTKTEKTNIKYFSDYRAEYIDKEFIEKLSDDEFNKFAFAYKGRKLLLDNIEFK